MPARLNSVCTAAIEARASPSARHGALSTRPANRGGKAQGKEGIAQRSLPKCCVVQARMQGVGIWLRIPVPAIQNGANRMPRSGVYAQNASATT